MSPYPYLVLEDQLEVEVLRDVRRNWPGVGSFSGEVPGNFVCNVSDFLYEGHGFWGNFTYTVVPKLVIGLLAGFAEFLEKRFPGERDYYLSNYSFMQSTGTYGGHDVHTHHYHDPQWVMTVLVYLDPEVNGHEGTTIMRVKDGLDEAETAAQTLNWHDLTEEVKTIDYKQGRVFAFFENPISFHRVKPSKGLFGRRILRFHVAVYTGHVKRIYGVDLKTYQDMRKNPTKDPQVLEWMRNDIEMMRSTTKTMSDEERKEWANEIRLGIPKRQTVPDEPN